MRDPKSVSVSENDEGYVVLGTVEVHCEGPSQ